MTTKTKWIALIAITIVAVLILSALAEGAVRVRQYFKYGITTSQQSLYRDDPSTGLRVLIARSQSGPISVNSLGFRGPEIPARKPQGRIRIAFLGASTTYCAEVSSNEAVWPHIVVEQLRQRYPGVEFDYVNGGVPGYSVASSLKNFNYFVGKLEPDLVVIYHATNDLSYEARELALKRGLIQSIHINRESWLQQHSLLWDLALKNIRVLTVQHGAESAQGRLEVDGPSLGKEFRKDLESLVDTIQKSGPAIALATFSTRIRGEQSVEDKKRAAVSALVYMPFMTLDGLVAGYTRYNQIIREVAAEKGTWLIDGENDIPGDAAHFFDTAHFTDAGSRAMAERVVRSLSADARIERLIALRRHR